MFCTQCGQPLTPGARFCAACGAAVTGMRAPTPEPSPPESPGPPSYAPAPPVLPGAPSYEPAPSMPPGAPVAPAPPAPPPFVPPTVGVYPVGPAASSYGASTYAPIGPAAVPTPAVYAGFWRRWWGLFLDRIIIGALMLPIGLALGINMVWPFTSHADLDSDWLTTMLFGSLSMALIRTFAEWVYFAVFHSSSRQATPGQMLLGVYVTGLDGGRIGLGRASARYFASWVSAATLGIGFIVAAFTERRQTLHDMIASTLVLRGRPGRT